MSVSQWCSPWVAHAETWESFLESHSRREGRKEGGEEGKEEEEKEEGQIHYPNQSQVFLTPPAHSSRIALQGEASRRPTSRLRHTGAYGHKAGVLHSGKPGHLRVNCDGKRFNIHLSYLCLIVHVVLNTFL